MGMRNQVIMGVFADTRVLFAGRRSGIDMDVGPG